MTIKISNASKYSTPFYFQFHSDENATASTSNKVFQFDMKALRELLKAQSEQNPTASYFNIDILKYQVSTDWCILVREGFS